MFGSQYINACDELRNDPTLPLNRQKPPLQYQSIVLCEHPSSSRQRKIDTCGSWVYNRKFAHTHTF